MFHLFQVKILSGKSLFSQSKLYWFVSFPFWESDIKSFSPFLCFWVLLMFISIPVPQKEAGREGAGTYDFTPTQEGNHSIHAWGHSLHICLWILLTANTLMTAPWQKPAECLGEGKSLFHLNWPLPTFLGWTHFSAWNLLSFASANPSATVLVSYSASYLPWLHPRCHLSPHITTCSKKFLVAFQGP